MKLYKSAPEAGQFIFDRYPGECPICHRHITPILRFSTSGGRVFGHGLHILYSCPDTTCREFFIAYYEQGSPYQLSTTRPVQPRKPTFSAAVGAISGSFIDIFSEASMAEQQGLVQICGVGYRKALEFLMKDYLITRHQNEKDQIEAAMLGHCISKYVEDPRIKEVSRRAAWLGNDETHYQRRWIGKDLSDLKVLISLVVHWIEMEHMTEEALKSMHDPSKGDGEGA